MLFFEKHFADFLWLDMCQVKEVKWCLRDKSQTPKLCANTLWKRCFLIKSNAKQAILSHIIHTVCLGSDVSRRKGIRLSYIPPRLNSFRGFWYRLWTALPPGDHLLRHPLPLSQNGGVALCIPQKKSFYMNWLSVENSYSAAFVSNRFPLRMIRKCSSCCEIRFALFVLFCVTRNTPPPSRQRLMFEKQF